MRTRKDFRLWLLRHFQISQETNQAYQLTSIEPETPQRRGRAFLPLDEGKSEKRKWSRASEPNGRMKTRLKYLQLQRRQSGSVNQRTCSATTPRIPRVYQKLIIISDTKILPLFVKYCCNIYLKNKIKFIGKSEKNLLLTQLSISKSYLQFHQKEKRYVSVKVNNSCALQF